MIALGPESSAGLPKVAQLFPQSAAAVLCPSQTSPLENGSLPFPEHLPGWNHLSLHPLPLLVLTLRKAFPFILNHISPTAAPPLPHRAPHEMLVRLFSQTPSHLAVRQWHWGTEGLGTRTGHNTHSSLTCSPSLLVLCRKHSAFIAGARRAASNSSCPGQSSNLPNYHLLSGMNSHIHHQSCSPLHSLPLPPWPRIALKPTWVLPVRPLWGLEAPEVLSPRSGYLEWIWA